MYSLINTNKKIPIVLMNGIRSATFWTTCKKSDANINKKAGPITIRLSFSYIKPN